MSANAHKDRYDPDAQAYYFGPGHLWDGPEGLGDQINLLIDRALEREVARERPRAYLGGSRVGLECHRRLAYEYEKGRADAAAYAADPEGHLTAHDFDGKIIRRFKLGHLHEDETARWLRLAGFDLRTHKADGGQFGFYAAKDPETGEARFSGHFDGRIEAGPVPMAYPALWEHKIMASKKWREVQSKGVKAVYPVYYYQCQTYMAYGEMSSALFTALNTDTSELLFEVLPFDQGEAQWATDRAVQVLEAGSPEEFPRIARDDTDFRCRFCPFSERCWERPSTPEPARPAWLGGGG